MEGPKHSRSVLTFNFNFFECLFDLFLGFLRCQADYNDQDACNDECRQEFVDVQDSIRENFTYDELPDKDRDTAGKHSGNDAELVGTFPEKTEKYDRSEHGAETGPCERYDTEYGT